MKRSLLIGTLCLSLIAPGLLMAEGPDVGTAGRKSASSLLPSNPPAATPQDQQPTSVRPDSTPQQRSYQREVPRRRHSHISKGEIIFMAGIAGTSMGIGALAGGGMGLVIGAIVGGWGAFAGHKIWHWVNQ